MADPTDPRAVADDPSGIVQQMPEGGDGALKPCPWCQSKFRLSATQVCAGGGWGIICKSCHVYHDARADSPAAAIAAWNRRADRAAPTDNTALVERHANKQRNVIINRCSTDLETIINGHDPEIGNLNNDVWDRLDKMAVEIEAALASREAPPASQQEAVTVAEAAATNAWPAGGA